MGGDRADAASVIATLDGLDGATVVRARYTFYIVDAADVTGLVDGSINMRFTEHHFLLVFPMGGGRMRLLGVVRDVDLDDDGRLPEQNVRSLVRREFGVEYSEASWFTTYRVSHRLAARFRDGPCLIVGDAAHIHSPVGAQGMNTGLQEAHNLACAIADVAVGGMPDRRLDRYEAERRPVGRTLVATTDRPFGQVTSESRFARAAGRRDRVVGRRLQWSGSNFGALRSMTWQVHGYGSYEPEPRCGRSPDSLGLEAHAFPARMFPFARNAPGVRGTSRANGNIRRAGTERMPRMPRASPVARIVVWCRRTTFRTRMPRSAVGGSRAPRRRSAPRCRSASDRRWPVLSFRSSDRSSSSPRGSS
ncbi:hypothetical protein GCM10023152_06600 [Agromyces bauzanensis]|uniref:FAD-binding domain-containing protein n=1 Tax=Agromyces bauzanensis TaxID=1308924 RepID=A0A917PJ38_9MICO|nr:hypothetical protein GCM10011372_18670 [Agromyces bauzanensis]